MFERFDRSMKLFSASWRVLKDDKSLAVYPVISTITALVIMATFAVPVLTMYLHTSQHVDAYGTTRMSASLDPMGWVLVGLGYFVLTYVGIFCNAALIYAANERLTGTGPGTLASGFSGAYRKAGAIVPWAILSATVTVVLRMIEQRSGILGRLVISIVGIVWTLLTYLVVPIIVLEEVSTGQAISRSSQMFKRTWGENVVGNIGFGIFTFAAMLCAFALVALGIMTGTTVGVVSTIVLAVLFLAVTFEVIAAMSGIYRVALYRYAVDGVAPTAYASIDFRAAFRPKKKGGLFGSSSTSTMPHPGESYPSGMYGASAQYQPTTRTWTPDQAPGAGQTNPDGFGITLPGEAPSPGASTSPPAPPAAPGAGGQTDPWGEAPGHPGSPRGF
jgi:hypothetical protein